MQVASGNARWRADYIRQLAIIIIIIIGGAAAARISICRPFSRATQSKKGSLNTRTRTSKDGILVPKPPSFFSPEREVVHAPGPALRPRPGRPRAPGSGAGSGSGSDGTGSRPAPAGGNDGAPEPPEASGFPPPGDEEDDSAAYLGELMAAAAAGRS